MIILEEQNRIIYETLCSRLKSDCRDPLEVKISDFNDCSCLIFVDPDHRDTLKISYSVPCWAELKGFGIINRLKQEFGSLVGRPDSGYDFTLTVDLNKPPENIDNFIAKISCIKSIVLGHPFFDSFNALRKGEQKAQEPKTYNLRKDTTIYIFPGEDRVTLVYSIDILEKSDRVIAKVFLQEFQEAKRRVPNAPICTFSLNPPHQMTVFGMNPEEPTGNFGWITFAVLKRHVETETKCNNAVQLLQGFRTYLQYHIKCSKAHFHQRMRARVISLLQVLNRSRMAPAEEKGKKTITGRTFTRQ